MQNFAERVPGVNEAVVVSSDGLPIATSSGLDRDAADRFAAVASGLIGLAYGAAGRFGGGAVNEVIIEMENAFLFVTGISDGSCLACVPAPSATSAWSATRWPCWSRRPAPSSRPSSGPSCRERFHDESHARRQSPTRAARLRVRPYVHHRRPHPVDRRPAARDARQGHPAGRVR